MEVSFHLITYHIIRKVFEKPSEGVNSYPSRIKFITGNGNRLSG